MEEKNTCFTRIKYEWLITSTCASLSARAHTHQPTYTEIQCNATFYESKTEIDSWERAKQANRIKKKESHFNLIMTIFFNGIQLIFNNVCLLHRNSLTRLFSSFSRNAFNMYIHKIHIYKSIQITHVYLSHTHIMLMSDSFNSQSQLLHVINNFATKFHSNWNSP